MSKPNPMPEDRLVASVHVQVSRGLMGYLDLLRAAIQADLKTHLVISRGDVVRLAIRRLYLDHLAHLSEGEHPPADLLEQWNDVVSEQHTEQSCPDWLVPGRPEVPVVKKKKGR